MGESLHDEQVQAQGNILCSPSNRYQIDTVCGEGTFGKVYKGVNVKTSKAVVLKFLKREDVAQREIVMLETVSTLDLAKTNIVRCKEKFTVSGQTCLVFQQLDMNLSGLLGQRRGRPLNLSEIRSIAYQLLTAFDALKSIHVVHSNLRPDNVMLVNHKNEPFRVKLIDFAVSFMTSENMYGKKIQPLGYRSPEVNLGLPVSEAIDMWGLGCLLIFLYLGNHPFSINCEYQGMRGIVDMLGQPSDYLLKAGLHTNQFFIKDKHWCYPAWWLRAPSEYRCGTVIEARGLRSLEDLITRYPLLNGQAELQDRRAFVSLLKGLLEIDPKRRLKPKLGLSHPFISMAHLEDCMGSPYVMDCLDKMLFIELIEEDDEGLCLNGVDQEEDQVEEAAAKPLSNDPGSAAPQANDRVEGLDQPCGVAAADSGEQVKAQDNILCSPSNRYQIDTFCGEGTFGKVYKGVNVKTSKAVVLKFLKREDVAQREIVMLETVSTLDLAKTNIVRCKEKFTVSGQTCLVFQQLDMNLSGLLGQRRGRPLNLSEIRSIAYQLLTAFDALKSIQVVHSDLKPDNVMLVNHKSEPFRVKLIDFGVSFMASENMYGKKIQPLGYRSPEVTLGLPVSEAIDMWGLGCLIIFLYLGNDPFSINCEYQGMRGIVDMLGQPSDYLLKAALHTNQFFIKDKHWCYPAWWFRAPSEYRRGTVIEARGLRSLEDLITLYPLLNGQAELQDRRAFVSLLKGLLEIDANWRLTPEIGLSHPFISMAHLEDCMGSPYVMYCLDKMVFLDLHEEDDEGLRLNGVDQEEDQVEEAASKRLSDDQGSAAPQASDRVEDQDQRCGVTPADLDAP